MSGKARVNAATHVSLHVPWRLVRAQAEEQTGIPPAALRFTGLTPVSAARFIDAHAGEPASVMEIAAAAGVTTRALHYAFRRHYDITPAQYQRLVRLERAHLELQQAEPGDGLTVTEVARKWGWASPARFAAAYQRRFSVLPGHTLRTFAR